MGLELELVFGFGFGLELRLGLEVEARRGQLWRAAGGVGFAQGEPHLAPSC